MKRCISKTKTGHRCLNQPLAGGDFCTIHQPAISAGEALAIGAGALVGNAVVPGVGGVVLGGIAGRLIRIFLRSGKMAKTRVFVSFDFDNDRVLKDFILGQAKLGDSPFEIIDHSLKEAAPERDWEKKARAAISRADIVVVMVGPKTHKAQGVLKEVAMARDAGIKIVQVIGYKDGDYTAVPDAGRLYAWNWENLKKLLG
ncbi:MULTISPECIES: TIR domain-containing protein [Burkholderia]|uniref:TIR domain-containing protein n=1 Tax=Burkholderia TaxID=32008 RepID=UPI0009BD0B0C|nr:MULTISPECIES: TIR domain-containing protein [Burkholderia]MCM2482387.1 TIR domain-containing protein [Burkholderia glumae]MCM2507469.1 TIR domain-containing protein [Burkholderia glumae]